MDGNVYQEKITMTRKKKFAPNDNQLTISYFCFSLHAKRTHSAMRPFILN